MSLITNPQKIEARSFEIIDRYLIDRKLPHLEKDVIKRVIHATADVNYAKELSFHAKAIEAGLEAIRKGKDIVVDSNMVKAGINENLASKFGGRVICLIADRQIILRSSRLKLTRAILAMRKSARSMGQGIVAIGNAPTALFELCDLVEKGKARPALIVGVPVGFVGAVESKKRLRTLKVPFITNGTRCGGSSVACAIINALLKLAEGFSLPTRVRTRRVRR